MTYELAKKLKDTGYPQVGCHWFYVKTKGYPYHHISYPNGCNPMNAHDDTTIVAVPDLEELIQNCVDEMEGTHEDNSVLAFFSLKWVFDNGWQAHIAWSTASSLEKFEGHGNTQTQAVADLWIAIKEKKQKT